MESKWCMSEWNDSQQCMIISIVKEKYPMTWRDTCASWCWCCKLSQQTGRDKFPPPASSRKRPLRNIALELLLWHKQPATKTNKQKNGKKIAAISYVFFTLVSKLKSVFISRMVRNPSPCSLWRLSQPWRWFVQLRGTQRDLSVFETEVDEHLW